MHSTNYPINISKLFAEGLEINNPFECINSPPGEQHGAFICSPFWFHYLSCAATAGLYVGRENRVILSIKAGQLICPLQGMQSDVLCQNIVKGEKKKHANVTSANLMSIDQK